MDNFLRFVNAFILQTKNPKGCVLMQNSTLAIIRPDKEEDPILFESGRVSTDTVIHSTEVLQLALLNFWSEDIDIMVDNFVSQMNDYNGVSLIACSTWQSICDFGLIANYILVPYDMVFPRKGPNKGIA